MTRINSYHDLVGGTPLYDLKVIETCAHVNAHLLAKLEYFNPAGSIKDRIALHMIEKAEQDGKLRLGATIIEPTSGNTGIGLAAAAAALGYKTIFTMPDTMSVERRNLLSAYGAKIVLTPGSEGMKGAIRRADELAGEIDNSFVPAQFDNQANPETHELSTGPEIWEDTQGRVDILIAGVGTGGTITGVGGYLKKKNPAIEVIAVEPDSSAVLSGEPSGAHKIQGIGAGFVPSVLDTTLYDRIIRVKDADAFSAARLMATCEGILVGVSSGAALHAALEVGREPDNQGKTVVIIMPDTGARYLSMPEFLGGKSAENFSN